MLSMGVLTGVGLLGCRVEVEEQNDRSLAMFQKSATVHSEEVKCFQENLFRQKGLAEQYSQRITELEQGKAGLEAELLDFRTKMERAVQEASTASREVGGSVGGFQVLKAFQVTHCVKLASTCCPPVATRLHLAPRCASSCTGAW